MALFATTALLVVTACSDDESSETSASSAVAGSSTTASSSVVPSTGSPASTTPSTTAPDTAAPDSTAPEAPTTSAPDTTTPAPTTEAPVEPSAPEVRPLSVGVTVDDDGCRLATYWFDFETVEDADLVLPDGVEAEADDLVRGTGTVVDGPAPDGCAGTSQTVEFETVSSVENMTEPPEPDVDEMLATQFDQAWECGRGFTMTDVDQRWAVAIEPIAGDVTRAAGETITLPSERFSVVVAYGIDLMAGNCDTSREPFSPAEILLDVWPVTEGSFLYPDATVICDGSSVETELVGAVVETPDGPVDLPPIAMVNPAFACGPGWDD